VIDFLMMALFVAQPRAPPPPRPPPPPLARPCWGRWRCATRWRFSAKLVTATRPGRLHRRVLVKHRTLDLRCDKMTAYYTGPSQEVTRVECAGNVRAVDGDRNARGERPSTTCRRCTRRHRLPEARQAPPT